MHGLDGVATRGDGCANPLCEQTNCMLVISRNIDERLVLGGCVVVQVHGIRRDSVVLCIKAPSGFVVAGQFARETRLTLEQDGVVAIRRIFRLTPSPDDQWTIDNEATISLMQIKDDRVRLGVSAPKEVICHRSEVGEAIQMHANGSWPLINKWRA